MIRFNSEYNCKVDIKGRLVLPARLKTALPETGGNTLMLMQGFEPCLLLYPMLEYHKIYSKIVGLDELKKEDRNIQRNFFRRSVEVELDTAGRVLIPRNMIEAVKIGKEVKVIGAGSKIEIWNPELFKDFDMTDSDLENRVENI